MTITDDDMGSALVETILLILVLFVPLVVLLGTLARVHQAALAVTTAAREAGSAGVAALEPRSAVTSARRVAALVLRDQSLRPDDAKVHVGGAGAFRRGARIEVGVAYPVRVLDVPFLSQGAGPAVWVRASHAAYVDPYRSRP